ncbi:hypothetical protein HYQ45_002285 [Verticillium longisporum]|uniref:Stress-response A/B barrel domain-containing protein n=3 Tax=Verticillium TaxID=1036719 RepID=G2XI87_VERDV|nr:uncharacterized protein VDAG_09869 [Verticillium dahliae VdLs.17]KAF3347311.1 Ferric reductase transmembrane component 3 [Verticillium dahliae VDG2]KAF3360826.1 Nucleolar protein 58 [Verticillium dahliae VDG1]KAG7141036.1 hypothetical protein HYQ45_002285 [Verticillium longisporum]KAH6701848.1 stress responsive A/B barrel domain-containing protein [Verticillium dahliae]EGY19535.1 hypothetical protein VDAG_09869 [Verticillium dahliae VdLs.17]
MPFVQVTQIQFKELVVDEEVKSICDGALALKASCLHPTTGQPLIKSITGGIDQSTEGRQGGMTHVFVTEFETEDDRRIYVNEDQQHRKFCEQLSDMTAKISIVDFAPGVF